MENSASEEQWYWSKKGSDERNGPVGRGRLEELVEEGTLDPEDLVWSKGLDDWMEADSVEEIEELFASPPPLPDDPSVENNREETPPPIPESGKFESAEEYDFPIEFEVEWAGSLWGNESTLRIYKDKISLHTDDSDNHGGSIGYNYFEVKEEGFKRVTVEAPFGFNEDLFVKKYYIEFESKEEKEAFLEVYRRNASMESKDDPSTRLQSESENDEPDGRYWYNKKKWAVPLFLILIPSILWNMYDIYISNSKGQEWFEKYVPLFFQLSWFPPVGWYGLAMNDSLTRGKSMLAGLVSPLLFFLCFSVIMFPALMFATYPLQVETANKFEENRSKILKSLSENNNVNESYEKASKYLNALQITGRNDDRLSAIYDSLEAEKEHEELLKGQRNKLAKNILKTLDTDSSLEGMKESADGVETVVGVDIRYDTNISGSTSLSDGVIAAGREARGINTEINEIMHKVNKYNKELKEKSERGKYPEGRIEELYISISHECITDPYVASSITITDEEFDFLLDNHDAIEKRWRDSLNLNC
ncbi:hypothetical protein GGP91_001611 [Salinibacter ruber]|uniref:DUF4339 domain-containing protein n=1 Tax=Salinibacter ruber TaxID=146919 RepID=UPI002168E981|nr:DUF4339 domain-containing protein [Salinibacter ruber]MCS3829534.1 hypothetical protein [Salinibacter ruber]